MTETWDITYTVAPDDETPHTQRIQVTDPDPQPGHGPSIATLHRALRKAVPHLAALPPEAVEIIKVREAD